MSTGRITSGYVTAYPSDAARPTVSSLNVPTGQTIPNMVVSKVGAGGKVSFYSSGSADVIADLAGSYSS